MIRGSVFAAVVAAEQVFDLADQGTKWPQQVTVIARDGLSEVAVGIELSTPTSPAFAALTAPPAAGYYLLPKVAGFKLEIEIPQPPPIGGDLKIHVFGTVTSTNIAIISE